MTDPSPPRAVLFHNPLQAALGVDPGSVSSRVRCFPFPLRLETFMGLKWRCGWARGVVSLLARGLETSGGVWDPQKGRRAGT